MLKLVHQIVAFVLSATVCGLGAWWLAQYETYSAVQIDAVRDTAKDGVAVYSQFVVTQSLHLDKPASATRLILPLYMPTSEKPLAVTLRRNGSQVQTWERFTIKADEVIDAPFTFDYPRLLDGTLEVEISATSIPHEDSNQAPQVLSEMADENYPNGNFRIADNEKKGDIALTLQARRQRWERIWQQWKDRPLDGIAMFGMTLLTLMIIAALPGIILKRRRHRSDRQSAKK